ncbi:MAG: hypothetical protein U0359_25570 [Byssovorax sp.]
MKTSVTPLRPLRSPFFLLSLTLAPVVLGASCATSVATSGSTGSGGSPTTSGTGGSTGEGGSGGQDAGPDAPPGTCVMAVDCAGMNDACNVGTCINGTCQKTPANEFGNCDDGQYCTENDICQQGVCKGGSFKFCPSPDSCHLGVCDEATKGCGAAPGNDGAQCDDMDACTSSGVCQNGVCAKGTPLDCSLFDSQCSKGVCQPGLGCAPQAINEGGPCDNGDVNGCSQGQCKQGMCTSIPKNDGQSCDDNKYCTINDHCQGGSCTGDPNPCAPPDDVCKIGVCDENFKMCTVTNGNEGGVCSDGNPCTINEKCQSGQCVGGVAGNQGQMCDDGNGCTMGTTCNNGVCGNPGSQIQNCVSGDSCCPAGCTLAQDADCLYYVPGVQQNVPPAMLQGWTQCWSGTYADSGPDLGSLLATCNKSKLLMACRPVGQQNFTLLAMGPRLDVTFDCGQQDNCTKQSNGVGFYFSNSWSWGFAPGGQAVHRFSCDYTDAGNPLPFADQRMCWHTGGNSINSGYRCGANDLNGAANWQRLLFHAD